MELAIRIFRVGVEVICRHVIDPVRHIPFDSCVDLFYEMDRYFAYTIVRAAVVSEIEIRTGD